MVQPSLRPALRYLTLGALAAAQCLTTMSCARPSGVAQTQPQSAMGPADPTMRSGAEVVSAMHDRYASSWYRTLTFTQQTTLAAPNGGTTTRTWWEAGVIPGLLRIDTDSVRKGTFTIYRADSVYSFVEGKLSRSQPGINDLLVIGFDVYRQPVNRTLDVLRKRNVDVEKVHEDTWRGVPVWVIGALTGDTTSKQLWIEKDRLLFVRLAETQSTSTGPRRIDFRFDNYKAYGGGWVAERVTQFVDGRQVFLEVYANVQVDVALDERIFDPARLAQAVHWAR